MVSVTMDPLNVDEIDHDDVHVSCRMIIFLPAMLYLQFRRWASWWV